MAPFPQTPLKDNPAYREMTVEEFLELEIEGRAELVAGVLYMMGGSSPLHAAITVNISATLRDKLRGTGCRPMSPDMAVRTAGASVRMPDVSVFCRSDWSGVDAGTKLLGDPRLVVEVLSPSTSRYDQEVKLNEYRSLAGLDAILFVDPEAQRVRIVERTGSEAWSDRWLAPGADIALACLDITLSSRDVFGLD